MTINEGSFRKCRFGYQPHGHDLKSCATAAEDTVFQNASAQTAAALHPFFGAWSQGQVHPVTGFVRLDPCESDSLQFKLRTNQGVQVQNEQ
jgi:hypothetical protein